MLEPRNKIYFEETDPIYVLISSAFFIRVCARKIKNSALFTTRGYNCNCCSCRGFKKPSRNNKERKKIGSKLGIDSWFQGIHVFNQNNHFSGTDEERATDFQNALDNPTIKAIWAARGGYGCVRVIDKLDYSAFLKQPKWIVGYSDITAFHSQVHNLGVETIHGMMARERGKPEEIIETISSFKRVLFGEQISYKIPLSVYTIELLCQKIIKPLKDNW